VSCHEAVGDPATDFVGGATLLWRRAKRLLASQVDVAHLDTGIGRYKAMTTESNVVSKTERTDEVTVCTPLSLQSRQKCCGMFASSLLAHQMRDMADHLALRWPRLRRV